MSGPEPIEARVAGDGRSVDLTWSDGLREALPPVWLCDNAQALDLHTDNPYRDPVPTLQLLHAITADAGGGETLFVDGFAHAEAGGALWTIRPKPGRNLTSE